MSDRWPALMRVGDACAYLGGISETMFRGLKIPAVQLTERGDRMWCRADLDAFLAARREKPVQSRA